MYLPKVSSSCWAHQILPGLRWRHAGSQAADGLEDPHAADVEPLGIGSHLRIHRDRQPEIGADRNFGPAEPPRSDAHDGEGLAVDPHRPAHRLGIGAEQTRPAAVAQHHHGMGAGRRVLLGGEKTPAGRSDAEQGEVVGGHEHAGGPHGLAPTREAHRMPLIEREIHEGMVALLEIEEVREGMAGRSGDILPRILAPHHVDCGQRPQVLHWQGPQEQRVPKGKDRGVETDPQYQRKHRRGGEAGFPRKKPNAESNVAPQMLHESVLRS